MEESSSLWNWRSDYQEEEVCGTEEQKHALFYSALELETRVAYAREELSRRKDDVLHLNCLLAKAIKERDESRFMCQRLVLENLILQQEVQKFEATATFARVVPACYIEDDPIAGIASSSESTEFFAKTQKLDKISLPLLPPSSLTPHAIDNMVLTKRLPQKGKFLQTMMEAGPLLQTLLLAGPIPQWRNPPPQLNSINISLATTPLSFATTPQNASSPKRVDKCNHSDGMRLISKK